MVCFEDRLATEWYRIYQAMETVVDGHIGMFSINQIHGQVVSSESISE